MTILMLSHANSLSPAHGLKVNLAAVVTQIKNNALLSEVRNNCDGNVLCKLRETSIFF
jgi:hypothetical protein